ncbi:MAG: AAA family ATPase [Candidatus Aenigmarchaeota archaeon]|nr:AAA family ATPase [Candidatus Aenigmarchaeota archaeon]
MAIERVPTGINGLDELMEGGFVKNSSVLVTGKTGAGKTTFISQYLYGGAKLYREPGILVTTEETSRSIRNHGSRFGWNMEELENKGLLKIIEVEPFSIDTLVTMLEKEIQGMHARRIVIDSVSMFEMYIDKQLEMRKMLFKTLRRLKDLGTTVMITAEIPEDSQSLSRYGVIEFAADAVIVLQYMTLTKYKRSLLIRKMRDTNHSTDIHPFEIMESGISILSI